MGSYTWAPICLRLGWKEFELRTSVRTLTSPTRSLQCISFFAESIHIRFHVHTRELELCSSYFILVICSPMRVALSLLDSTMIPLPITLTTFRSKHKSFRNVPSSCHTVSGASGCFYSGEMIRDWDKGEKGERRVRYDFASS